uniref:Secreted protein n=1 Tax=Meloidogyne incognita TaxID=6306 RepID=A0A914N122_MELIC
MKLLHWILIRLLILELLLLSGVYAGCCQSRHNDFVKLLVHEGTPPICGHRYSFSGSMIFNRPHRIEIKCRLTEDNRIVSRHLQI